MATVIDRYAPSVRVRTDWGRLETMAIGDSFVVKQSESGYKGASTRVCVAANRLGTRYSVRTTPDGKIVSRIY